MRRVTSLAALVDFTLLRFFVKVSPALENGRSDDGEEAGMRSARDVLHRGRGLGDGNHPRGVQS